ncbi:hypothetical protein RFI_02634 [Reticulomyxa filosa]|uniref:Phosphatidic acid phosphatase type 2/haloperoxidase domain-containing protein n=1 Tax=Reticulomyxa filosa TaxID=46433 RepID=X6P7H2_RETFI|nr:hypothetical protein RFI_02634 [Reticulomyxa filosa]|eukprot:ETO34460.1 hypothetical protein RFI_02634 [Reticulomyxa filosa]
MNNIIHTRTKRIVQIDTSSNSESTKIDWSCSNVHGLFLGRLFESVFPSTVLPLCIVVLPFVLSTYVAITRLIQYWHHYSDVIAGGRFYFYFFFSLHFFVILMEFNSVSLYVCLFDRDAIHFVPIEKGILGFLWTASLLSLFFFLQYLSETQAPITKKLFWELLQQNTFGTGTTLLCQKILNISVDFDTQLSTINITFVEKFQKMRRRNKNNYYCSKHSSTSVTFKLHCDARKQKKCKTYQSAEILVAQQVLFLFFCLKS